VLECLAKYSLRLKLEKCEFYKQELPFLGYMVGKNGIRMSEDKIQDIKTWEKPKNVKDIQSFLGFVNFN
jgi:hypothetical protein